MRTTEVRVAARPILIAVAACLVASLVIAGIALEPMPSAASASSRLIRPGIVTCVYDDGSLSAIRVAPPKAASWWPRRTTFAKWQAVLLKKREDGEWGTVASTDFDPPFTKLEGRKFRRLAPAHRFASTLPPDGYLRVETEVRWARPSGASLGRKSALATNYKGSETRGCLKEKASPSPSPSSSPTPTMSPSPSPSASPTDIGSPVWWGNGVRTALDTGASRFVTDRNLVPVAGDFDGDGASDILWYDPSGPETMWWGSGRVFSAATAPNQMGAGMTPVVGNFDGDAFDDVYWYVSGDGNDLQWWGRANRVFEPETTSDARGEWDNLVVGDFDGDGPDDIYFYAKKDKTTPCGDTTGQVIWWGRRAHTDLGSGGTSLGAQSTECYYLPLSLDADGDTLSDLLFYGQAPNGRDALHWGTRTRAFTSAENARFDGALSTGYRPVTGDFDGDERGDVFWFSPNGVDSQWWGIPPGTNRQSYGSASTPFRTAVAIDGDFYPISGDFDGDGKDDIFWYER